MPTRVRPLSVQRLVIGLAIASLVGTTFAPESSAQAAPAAYPAGPQIVLTEIATAAQPVGVYGRPGKTEPHVIEKGGRIRVVNGASWGETLLDIRDRVSTQNERGLFAMYVPTAEPTRLFVTYAARDGSFTLSEFTIAQDRAEAGSERVLLRIAHPNDDHYAGAIVGDDNGNVLVSTGDGGGVGTRGGQGDRANNAQNLKVLYGKILRINPNPVADRPYGIPTDNPFASGRATFGITSTTARPEIWAYGLRNPWRMSRSSDGALWIADVGQAKWEEINRVPVTKPGINFGWKIKEGMHAYRGDARMRGLTDPIFEFAHDKGRCAVVGGAVIGPEAKLPKLVGSYLFTEVCTGRVAALQVADGKAAAVDLGERRSYMTWAGAGPDGRMYVTSLNGGVYRVDAAA